MTQRQRLKINHKQKARYERIRRLSQIQALDPIDFEYFVGYLYRNQGYRVSTTVTSGDEGVDLFLRKGRKTAIVQCKRYAGTVGQPTVRDLYGAMIHNKANEAMLVTSGAISRPAEDWAQGKPIQLIDGHELVGWARKGRRSRRYQLPAMPWKAAGLILLLVLVGMTLLLGVNAGLALLPDDLPSEGEETDSGDKPVIEVLPTAVSGHDDPAANSTPTLIATTSDQVVARRIDVPPLIDGDLSDWPAQRSVASSFIAEQMESWDGTLDVTAVWRLAWDEQQLYLAVIVADDVHVQTQPAQFAYRGDSLEVQFDTDLEGDYGPHVNGDDFQYVLSPGNFKQIPPGLFRFRGNEKGIMADAPGTAAAIAARRTNDGYTIEAAIPWSDLALRPDTGLILGAALSVNDNDTPGTAVQELMLSHVRGRLWLDPQSWGTLLLRRS